MKKLAGFVIFMMILAPNLFGQDPEPSEDVGATDGSKLKLSGCVQSHDGKNREAAIINDTILWDNKVYLYDEETGAIVEKWKSEDYGSLFILALKDVDENGVHLILTRGEDVISLFLPKRK